MNHRGRPKSPGILTPREWEVLGLLRQGLSNREIAERLDISLAGAKFHVSDIITKLGVGSREEAAVWKPAQETKRGLLLPGWLRRPAPAPKPGGRVLVASAGATFATAIILGILAIALAGSGGAGKPAVVDAVAPSPTPDPRCPEDAPSCVIPMRFATIAEAASHASFSFKAPLYIPGGFTLKGTMYVPSQQARFYLTAATTPVAPPNGPLSGDTVVLFYEDAEGHTLNVSEGHPAFGAGIVSLTQAPSDAYGLVSLGQKEARWLNGVLDAPFDMVNGKLMPRYAPRWVEGLISVTWPVDTEGGVYDFSPRELTYSIGSNILPLVELVRVAESVPN